jgi:hypothetical protein
MEWNGSGILPGPFAMSVFEGHDSYAAAFHSQITTNRWFVGRED